MRNGFVPEHKRRNTPESGRAGRYSTKITQDVDLHVATRIGGKGGGTYDKRTVHLSAKNNENIYLHDSTREGEDPRLAASPTAVYFSRGSLTMIVKPVRAGYELCSRTPGAAVPVPIV